ncbi:MAG: GNAT family N-acetyltransferase [Eubacteriales bacterium]
MQLSFHQETCDLEFQLMVPANMGENLTYFTATVAGEPAGVAVTQWSGLEYDMCLQFKYLFVEPKFRRHGIAKALVESLTQWAREAVFTSVEIRFQATPQSRQDLQDLWHSCGFSNCQLQARTYRYQVGVLQQACPPISQEIIGQAGEIVPLSQCPTLPELSDLRSVDTARSLAFIQGTNVLAYVAVAPGEAQVLHVYNGTHSQMVMTWLMSRLVAGLSPEDTLTVPVGNRQHLAFIHSFAKGCPTEISDQIVLTLPL